MKRIILVVCSLVVSAYSHSETDYALNFTSAREALLSTSKNKIQGIALADLISQSKTGKEIDSFVEHGDYSAGISVSKNSVSVAYFYEEYETGDNLQFDISAKDVIEHAKKIGLEDRSQYLKISGGPFKGAGMEHDWRWKEGTLECKLHVDTTKYISPRSFYFYCGCRNTCY